MGRMLRNLVSVKDEAGDMRRFVCLPPSTSVASANRAAPEVGANDTRSNASISVITDYQTDTVGMGSYPPTLSDAHYSKSTRPSNPSWN